MNQYLTFIAHKIGVDKAIAYSSVSRIVGAVTGILSVFFITTFLTKVEQGFYYTFGSIVALQVFFELGLTGIMTQYVAHEGAHLTLDEEGDYVGEEKYKSRLASLVRFCAKWYSVLAVVCFVFLFIAGYIFFNKYGTEHEGVSWLGPWVLICTGTAIKIFQSPFASILMGLGKVKEMSKVGFWQSLVVPIITWGGLACNFKLYVVGVGYLASVLLWHIYIKKTRLDKILIKLWQCQITEKVLYWKEIFPFQWKIALSWVSGYFIFQLFNPVLFATEGAVVAGQMGMTLQALNAIQAFSLSWLNTKVPLYSKLIALKDYSQLDNIFNRTLRQMAVVCMTLLSVFFVTIWFLNETQFSIHGNVLADRFLGYFPILLLMIPGMIRQYVNSWATYLRCHKQEPYLWFSVFGGIASCFCVLFFGNMYGLYGITISTCLQCVIFSPWGYIIYKSKKKEWHGE